MKPSVATLTVIVASQMHIPRPLHLAHPARAEAPTEEHAEPIEFLVVAPNF